MDSIYREYHITAREKQVAQLLAKGLLNKEISHQLGISHSTVDFHIQNLYKKLKVQNKVEFLNRLKK